VNENANIALVRRLLVAFATGDDRGLEAVIHPAHRDHVAGGRGPDGVRESIRRADRAGRRLIPEDIIASGDRVVARVRLSAADESAPRLGDSCEIHIWRVAQDRLVEHWMAREVPRTPTPEE
jgi:hypothetical protein